MKFTLQELFQKYIDEMTFVLDRSPDTIRGSKDAFRLFTTLVPEVSSLEDLSPEALTLFLKRIQTRERIIGKDRRVVTGVKPSTIVGHGGRLKTFSRWMFMRGYIEQDPFAEIRFEQKEFTDQQALGREQVQKIIGAACQYAANSFLLRRDLAMISLFIFCGLRRNELISVQMSDVDLYKNLIAVRAQTSKSKRVRVLPINLELKKHLREYFEERKKKNYTTQYFFVSNTVDRGLTNAGLKHWVEHLRSHSGVRFHIHQFRHTFAINLAMQDVGAVKIQNLMGHRQLSMTQSYLRSIDTKELRGDVNKLSFEGLR